MIYGALTSHLNTVKFTQFSLIYSDDARAEETCEKLLAHAFETDPDNIEALICQSSLRLSQQRPEDAKQSAMKAWLSWKDADDGMS